LIFLGIQSTLSILNLQLKVNISHAAGVTNWTICLFVQNSKVKIKYFYSLLFYSVQVYKFVSVHFWGTLRLMLQLK
jgi:hypothetical protein